MKMTDSMKETTKAKAEYIKQKFEQEVDRLYNSGAVGDNTKPYLVWSVALSNLAEEYAPLFPTKQDKKTIKNLKCF